MGRNVSACLNQLQLHFPDGRPRPRERKVQARCEQCGRLFGVPQWSAPKKVRLHFCGKACLEAWASVLPGVEERLVLTGRPQFRGGNWKVQAALARERDGFRCRNCGVAEETLGRQLDVHHKIPVRLFASAAAANRPDNLISVCRPCHKRMEDRTADEMPLFREVRHPGQRRDRG
ncbi:MAG: HNH endonuclease [Gemmatimonadota bacterium]|nr:HNH endonuclease [Gemmatimonadota bacterium]